MLHRKPYPYLIYSVRDGSGGDQALTDSVKLNAFFFLIPQIIVSLKKSAGTTTNLNMRLIICCQIRDILMLIFLNRTICLLLDSVHRLVCGSFVVFCKTSTYQTMDRVQKKPNSSVQRTPSSESFSSLFDFFCLSAVNTCGRVTNPYRKRQTDSEKLAPVIKSEDVMFSIFCVPGISDSNLDKEVRLKLCVAFLDRFFKFEKLFTCFSFHAHLHVQDISKAFHTHSLSLTHSLLIIMVATP
jgi:hypothetical protein